MRLAPTFYSGSGGIVTGTETQSIRGVVTAWQRQRPKPIRYNGTLLKAQIEIEGLSAHDRLQQGLERRRRRSVRPGRPAALDGTPGIKPALHVAECAWPGRRTGAWR